MRRSVSRTGTSTTEAGDCDMAEVYNVAGWKIIEQHSCELAGFQHADLASICFYIQRGRARSSPPQLYPRGWQPLAIIRAAAHSLCARHRSRRPVRELRPF